MKLSKFFAVFLVMALLISLAPFTPAFALTSVFINEIHYDNDGTDVGEAIEIAGPAGTDLTGWSLVRYNGSNGQVYTSPTADPAGSDVLSGTIPDLGGGYGVVVVNYLVNGLQNGAPDGIALVDASSNVVQFLSYEGSFTAVSGPADGMASIDIGVTEGSGTPAGDSLQLTGTGMVYEDFTWAVEALNTFGTTNNGQTFGTPAPPSITVFVNEIHYDNTGTDTGEAIEIAGPACTDLSGWSLVLYNGNGGAAYNTVNLNGPIPSLGDGYGALVVDYASNGIQNGSPDGIALVDAGNHVVQFLSYEGVFTAVGGPADGMQSNDIGVSEPFDTPVGYSLQLMGSGSTYDDFTWSSPALNTFGGFNTGQTFTGGGATNPCGIGEATPDLVSLGDSTLLTVAVTPGSNPDGTGLTVSCDLSAIGGSFSQPFFDDGTNGDAIAGDNTFSYLATVGAGTSSSLNNLSCTISDAESRTGTASISLTVVLPIGTVQGSVGDTDDGATFASPLVGQTVFVQGVIYQRTLARTSSGGSQYGFFIQNTTETADGDPNSSDGIFVFMSGFTDLIGGYVPQVGDEIILRGRVSEFFSLTELSSASALQVLRSDVDLDAELPALEVDPSSDLVDANRYWERREGMRAQVPAGSVVLNGRDVFASTADAEVWVARNDTDIAQRADPYARRAFRDPHPLDDIPDQLFDNGNGYRILMGSLGIKWSADDNTAMIAPARTFDTLTNAPIGGVYYSFGKYSVQVEQQIEFSDGVDPSLNAPPQTFDRTEEYSITTFNVENLYDYRDDPLDGCDFTGNSGCPGVSPPFDYVPANDATYQTRLGEIASQIIDDLHSPDIIMAQEAEDQDICSVVSDVFTCDEKSEQYADGKPDTLQELATVIASNGGPAYDAAYDRDGADDRGIVSGFLYRTDRVQLLPVDASDPVLSSDPQVEYRSDALSFNNDVSNPKALNAVLPDDVDRSTGTDGDNVFTRAPQVGHFRIWRDGIGTSVFTDIYAIDNHFSSGPDGRVGQRTEQANYNAAIVAALQEAYPNVYVTVGGDLNVYPRPDDPFTPPNTSDQLAGLYNQGLTNLWDSLVSDAPISAYSYVFQGQAQTLDQMFVTPMMLADSVQIRAAHINSDWPADYFGDGPRGTSDHDPQVARYSDLPTIDRLEALVMFYDANGMIAGNNTTRILLNRLDRARRFQEDGQYDAYQDQLQAFIDQIYDFTPQFITQEAADALNGETALLLSLP